MKSTLDLINRMQSEEVIARYAIGGAVGATFYLEPAATQDVDIFITIPSNTAGSLLSLTPIYEFLKAYGCRVEAEHIVVGEWPVQFLPAANPLEEEALAEARATQVEGVATNVFTAEHLMAIALRTGRAKDRSRILQFIEQEAFDQGKLNRILARHGLQQAWEDFQRKFLK